jgi:hypothetical protein
MKPMSVAGMNLKRCRSIKSVMVLDVVAVQALKNHLHQKMQR